MSAGLARLADEMILIAVVLLVHDRTGSKVLTALTVAGYTLPSVVSGPLLGAWLDRTARPIVALAGNQFVLAAMALGMVFAPAWWVPVLAFVAGVTLPMTSGGFTSMLPRLGGDLARLTPVDSMLYSATAICGPAAVGLIAWWSSSTATMVVICVLAAVGGVCTLRLVLSPAPPPSHPSLVSALRAGARHLVTTPPLRAATVASVVSFVGFGMFVTSLPWVVGAVGADDNLAGVVLGVLDLGCLVSVLVLRKHLARWLPERILFVTIGLFGVSFLALAAAGSFPWLLGLALAAGLASGPTLTALITARQRYSPPGLLGQVSTTGASLKIGAFSLGAVCAGLLSAPAAVLVVVAGIQFVAVAAGVVSGRVARTAAPVR